MLIQFILNEDDARLLQTFICRSIDTTSMELNDEQDAKLADIVQKIEDQLTLKEHQARRRRRSC